MATVIRLTRAGRKKKPFYKIVVTDSRKRRDGGWIEAIGFYNPLNPDFKKIIETNTIRHNKKLELLKNVLKGFDSLFIDFLAVVNDHDRFKEINNIMVEYKKIIDNAKNILHVDVMSCYKLQEDELKRIRNALERKYPSKNIEITNVIDESLIGGINIVCNGQNYDISLKRQLDVMKASL